MSTKRALIHVLLRSEQSAGVGAEKVAAVFLEPAMGRIEDMKS